MSAPSAVLQDLFRHHISELDEEEQLEASVEHISFILSLHQRDQDAFLKPSGAGSHMGPSHVAKVVKRSFQRACFHRCGVLQ